MAGDGKKLADGLADQIAQTPDGPHRRHLEELYRQAIYGNAVDPVPGAIAQFGGGSKTASILEKAFGALSALVSENPDDRNLLYAVTPWAAKSPEVRKKLAKRLGYDPHNTTYVRYQAEPDVPKTKGGRGGIFFAPVEDAAGSYRASYGGGGSHGNEGGKYKATAQVKPVNPFVGITRTRHDYPPEYLHEMLSKFVGTNEANIIDDVAYQADLSKVLRNKEKAPVLTKYLNRSDIRDILDSAKGRTPSSHNVREHVLAKIMNKQGYDASLTPRQAFMFDPDLYKIVSDKEKSLAKKPPEKLSQSAKTLLSTQRGKTGLKKHILSEDFNIGDYDLNDAEDAIEFQKNFLSAAMTPGMLSDPIYYGKLQGVLQNFGKIADTYGQVGQENVKTLLGASSLLEVYSKLKKQVPQGTPSFSKVILGMIDDANSPKTIEAVDAVINAGYGAGSLNYVMTDYYGKLLGEKAKQVANSIKANSMSPLASTYLDQLNSINKKLK